MNGLTLRLPNGQVSFVPDFSIGLGETVGLRGENGIGKSTFVRAVAGLTQASGTINVDLSTTAIMPQRTYLAADASVEQQIAYPTVDGARAFA